MSPHTIEPWTPGRLQQSNATSRWTAEQIAEATLRESCLIFSGGQRVAICAKPEDATRIAACVNICAGIDTLMLQAHSNIMDAETHAIRDVVAQRNLLLAAIEPFVKFNSSEATIRIEVRTADVERAREAIAMTKGNVQ